MKINGELFKDKVICVTGGLGSIGSDIVKGLLSHSPKEIIVVDNRETAMFYSKEYSPNPKVKPLFADVREYDSLEKAFEGVDIVFHAAAMKHVIVCEDAPFEAVKTNVIGTRNVLEAAIKNKVKKVILISTDKAVNPMNVMGATKLLAEKLVGAIATSKRKGSTEFGIVRFGNVLYSGGSVLEIWNKQLKDGRELTLTNGEMTRFFMSTPQCVKLIFKAAEISKDGEIFILKMPAVKMKDLAKAFLQLKKIPENKIKTIGIRKGEKMHEELLLEDDNSKTLENEELFVKLPTFTPEERFEEIKKMGFRETKAKKFLSSGEKELLNLEEIKKSLLGEEKFE